MQGLWSWHGRAEKVENSAAEQHPQRSDLLFVPGKIAG